MIASYQGLNPGKLFLLGMQYEKTFHEHSMVMSHQNPLPGTAITKL